MGFLGDIKDAWSAEDAREQTDEAFRDAQHAKRAEKVASSVGVEGQMSDEQAEELANLAWTGIDIGACKLLDKRYALTKEEHTRLVEATAPVMQKHLPADIGIGDLEAMVPVELVLFGTVLVVYWPKYSSAKREAAAAAEAKAKAAPAPEKEVSGQVTERRLNVVS